MDITTFEIILADYDLTISLASFLIAEKISFELLNGYRDTGEDANTFIVTEIDIDKFGKLNEFIQKKNKGA